MSKPFYICEQLAIADDLLEQLVGHPMYIEFMRKHAQNVVIFGSSCITSEEIINLIEDINLEDEDDE